MQGKSAWRMSRGPRRSKLENPSTPQVLKHQKMFEDLRSLISNAGILNLNMPLCELRALGSFCKSFVWLSHPSVFRNRHSARKLRPPGMDRKGESHEFIIIHDSHNLIYFFMLDCWLDESRGFCRDKVPIPKLKTVHQWIKRWQWSPKGMGSIACLFAVAGQSSTRHHSTFYPHFTCLYIRYDILVWFLSTLLDWKTHRNNPISHISLLFLPSLDHLCLLQCYGCCMFDRMGWWKRGGQSCQTSWKLPINSHCILLLPTWNYDTDMTGWNCAGCWKPRRCSAGRQNAVMKIERMMRYVWGWRVAFFWRSLASKGAKAQAARNSKAHQTVRCMETGVKQTLFRSCCSKPIWSQRSCSPMQCKRKCSVLHLSLLTLDFSMPFTCFGFVGTSVEALAWQDDDVSSLAGSAKKFQQLQ